MAWDSSWLTDPSLLVFLVAMFALRVTVGSWARANDRRTRDAIDLAAANKADQERC